MKVKLLILAHINILLTIGRLGNLGMYSKWKQVKSHRNTNARNSIITFFVCTLNLNQTVFIHITQCLTSLGQKLAHSFFTQD